MQPQEPQNPNVTPPAAPDAGMPTPQAPVTPPTDPGVPPANPMPGAPAPDAGLPPAPATPPMPGSDGAAPAPSFDTASSAAAAGGKNKKKLVMLIIAVAAVIILAVGGWFGYKAFFGGIKLETYTTNGLSMLVPSGYDKKDKSGATAFIKPGGNEDDNSGVFLFAQAYPQSITADQQKQVQTEIKTELQNTTESFVSDKDKMENVKITDITYKGHAALKMTASAIRDGKKIGDITLIEFTTDKSLYMVGVAVRTEDGSLGKSTDKIINSLEIK